MKNCSTRPSLPRASSKSPAQVAPASPGCSNPPPKAATCCRGCWSLPRSNTARRLAGSAKPVRDRRDSRAVSARFVVRWRRIDLHRWSRSVPRRRATQDRHRCAVLSARGAWRYRAVTARPGWQKQAAPAFGEDLMASLNTSAPAVRRRSRRRLEAADWQLQRRHLRRCCGPIIPRKRWPETPSFSGGCLAPGLRPTGC